MIHYENKYNAYFKEHHNEYLQFAKDHGMITDDTEEVELDSVDTEVYAYIRFEDVCDLMGWERPKPMPLGTKGYDATFIENGRLRKVEFKTRFFSMDDIFYDKGSSKGLMYLEKGKYAEMLKAGTDYVLMFFPIDDRDDLDVVNWALFSAKEYVKQGSERERKGGYVYKTEETVTGKTTGYRLRDCITYGRDDLGVHGLVGCRSSYSDSKANL